MRSEHPRRNISSQCNSSFFYKHQRKEELFDMFYSAAVDQAHSLNIGDPILPI